LQSQEGQQGDHQEGSSGHLHQSQSTPPPNQVTSPSQQDE